LQVQVLRDVTDLSSVHSDLVSKHTRCGDLDSVSPIVIVVTEGIGEVEDSVFGEEGCVFCDVEMSRFSSSLCDGMGDQEEVEFSINNFSLFNEPGINISSLRRIDNVSSSDLEESLSDSLVDENESDLRGFGHSWWEIVLLSNDLLELLKLQVDDHLSHGITNSISVDENVVRHSSFVEVSVALEGLREIILEDVSFNEFLTFFGLRGWAGIILAHVGVIGSNETDQTLFAFMADVNSNQHGFLWDFSSEVHSPEVTTEFGIDLSEDVHVDSIVVFVDNLGLNKLGDNWRVCVDGVLNLFVEVISSCCEGDDDQEKVEVLLGISFLGLLLGS
jgi:hypothetical protein